MKTLLLLICICSCAALSTFGQTAYKTIASNRIVQKHLHPSKIESIHRVDSARLELVWQYFSNSFTFETNGTPLTVEELLNIQQFDITEFEHMRPHNTPGHLIYKNSIMITLKPGVELAAMLQGHTINELITEIPSRAFPSWTSETFTVTDFENYKKEVWAWAKDYPEEYLVLTADENRKHIRFQEWKDFDPSRRQEFITQGNYLIID